MNPNNGSQGGGTPNPRTPQEDRSAAANVIRSQISALYGDRPVAQPVRDTPQQQPLQQEQDTTSAYARTHEAHPQPQAEQWKAYHTAWQNYYQQYYEAFYAHQSAQQARQQALQQQQTQSSIAPEQATHATATQTEGYFSHRTDLE